MTSRQFDGNTLIVASHNEGKVKEIKDLLKNLRIQVVSARNLGLAEPEETGATFRENAELKAGLASQAANLPALADDSGLAIEALGGEPGIFSARWGGESRDFNLAMEKIEKRLAGNKNRSAAFVCALSLSWPDGHFETFEGRVNGSICWPPRGERGFGYDPIFIASGMDLTFGEINPALKHSISHRADAFRQLSEACFAS
ncbi:MAG: RdgB/HAM1 family non-canonical purine NTP pyrophosphatase [Pseudomonadota bacterium]|nr:RdgB/HAM1 family non-canonical purine NTP pyrophosphatase [Pseudomonadota bacterium]